MTARTLHKILQIQSILTALPIFDYPVFNDLDSLCYYL